MLEMRIKRYDVQSATQMPMKPSSVPIDAIREILLLLNIAIILHLN